jgi:anti-sigma factor RsiW
MLEHDCEPVRRALALGERDPSVEAHVTSCEACAREARRLETLFRALGEDASIAPAPALDRRMRRWIAEATRGSRGRLRPLVATGMAAAGTIALTAGIGSALAETGAAEHGVVIGMMVVAAYCAVSSAATLPVLLLARSRRGRSHGEVRA